VSLQDFLKVFKAGLSEQFASSSSGVNGRRKAAPRVQGVVGPALRLAGDFDPFHATSKGCQYNFRLHAGNR
jgi:hypothetical protein